LDKNINKAHSELVRVQNIFIELMSTLDTSVGGWTTDIYDVYDFIRQELMKANMLDPEAICFFIESMLIDILGGSATCVMSKV